MKTYKQILIQFIALNIISANLAWADDVNVNVTVNGQTTTVPKNCIVTDQIPEGGLTPSAQPSARIVEDLNLQESWLTYPKLGAHSYKVKYWSSATIECRLSQTQKYRVIRTNICTQPRQQISNQVVVQPDVETQTLVFVPSNRNLDENIDNESRLTHQAETSVRQELKQYMTRNCKY